MSSNGSTVEPSAKDQMWLAVNAAERLYVRACEKLEIYDDKAQASRIAVQERIKAALGDSALGAQSAEGMGLHDIISMLAWGVGQLSERHFALERRVAELEATALMDGGTWEQGKTYRRSQCVQDHNAIWICEANTTSRPPGADWRLWVRREKRERK